GGSLEDDVEPGSAHALPEDALALAEKGLIEKVRDLLELRPRLAGAGGAGGERVDDVVADCHHEPSVAGCDPPAATFRSTTLAGSWMPMAFTMAPRIRSAAPTIIARWKEAVEASRTRLPIPRMLEGFSGLTALRKAGSLTLTSARWLAT